MKKQILQLALLVFFLAVTAQAATFSVNSILDTTDSNIGDGACNDGSGNCTLRAAIEEANSTGAADTIEFAIAPFDGSVKTITPATALPYITETVTIDGLHAARQHANCRNI